MYLSTLTVLTNRPIVDVRHWTFLAPERTARGHHDGSVCIILIRYRQRRASRKAWLRDHLGQPGPGRHAAQNFRQALNKPSRWWGQMLMMTTDAGRGCIGPWVPLLVCYAHTLTGLSTCSLNPDRNTWASFPPTLINNRALYDPRASTGLEEVAQIRMRRRSGTVARLWTDMVRRYHRSSSIREVGAPWTNTVPMVA